MPSANMLVLFPDRRPRVFISEVLRSTLDRCNAVSEYASTFSGQKTEGIYFGVIRSARLWTNKTDVREDIEKIDARGLLEEMLSL